MALAGKLEKLESQEEKGQGGKERLVRLLVLIGAAGLVVMAARSLNKNGFSQERLSALIGSLISRQIENIGEKVLGAAVKVLPGAPDIGRIAPGSEDDRENQKNQENQAGEPIVQPAENIRKQAEGLMESVKQLPQDQIKAIKKQIYQDFCQKLVEEEDE